MSISKTMLVFLVSVMFVFGVSCASDNSSKKVGKADKDSQKTVKVEGVSQEVTELAAQTTCPIMGSPINKNLYVDKDGKRIYMCCPACTDQITNNFQAMVEKLAEKGEQPETL